MRDFCNFVAQNHHMDKKLIIGTLFAVIITIGVTNAEDVDEIGYRYFLVSDVDSMMANGDRLCGPRKTFTCNKLALKWYQMAAERGNSTAMVRMGTIYREGWADEERHWKAIECYEDAVDADSTNVEALTELGGSYGLYAEDYKTAHSYLNKALEIDSTNLNALWYKVLFYTRQDNDKQMSNAIRRINAIDTTFVRRKLKEMDDD